MKLRIQTLTTLLMLAIIILAVCSGCTVKNRDIVETSPDTPTGTETT